MKWLKCKEIGEECGMFTPEECIRNISFHSTQLFYWPEIDKELSELKEDCAKHGIDYDKAFDTVVVASFDPAQGKNVGWRPNCPNDPAEIEKCKQLVRDEGYEPRLVDKLGE